MSYQTSFIEFWEEVKKAVEEERFAKLTMAKTIGKPNLRNIFIRPTLSEDGSKVLLKKRFRSRETNDLEEILTVEEARKVVEAHLKEPFWSVILFSTSKDLTLKINKKDIGSISESLPTFHEVVFGEMD